MLLISILFILINNFVVIGSHKFYHWPEYCEHLIFFLLYIVVHFACTYWTNIEISVGNFWFKQMFPQLTVECFEFKKYIYSTSTAIFIYCRLPMSTNLYKIKSYSFIVLQQLLWDYFCTLGFATLKVGMLKNL